jgi:PAS domain S-box-containing protein
MYQGIEILIVEDSPTQAAQLQHILESKDYCVSVANNGQQALTMLRNGEAHPALIISDITMPEMDGYELCHEIKADKQLENIPVMLLTSLSDPQDIVRGLECGADNFLTKPYEEKVLLSRIQYILLHCEVRREGRTQMGMHVVLGGKQLNVTPERQQILDLLFSSYETAVQKNLELQRVQEELQGLNESLEEKVEERTAELRTQQEFLRKVVDTNPNVIFVKDEQGRYTLVNQALADLYGTTVEKLIGKTDATFTNEDETERYSQQDRKVMETLQSQFIPEESYTDVRTNEVRWFQTIKTPLFSPGGKADQLLGVATDITERKRTEDALRQSEEQLRQSQKLDAIGQLAGGVAHDFNNLLTVISGYSNLLLRSLGEDHQRQKVEEIKKASERAAALTRQLLAFSRKQVLQPTVLNLNDIILDMDKLLRRLIGEDLDVLTAMGDELWQVKADAGQIEQVLMNLAVNARDAMPSGGKLTIETANVYLEHDYSSQHIAVQPGPYVMLAVSDDGCGMDKETQAHIFDPFFTTKELGKGTGLGLSTVYGIVKQSGGNIEVYSEAGKGTTFKIYLPQVCEAIEQREETPARTAMQAGTESILLVEDDDILRQLVRVVLESNGYRVLVAAHGGEALQISESYQGLIHLLVTDVVMPEMGGRKIAECLAQSRPGMKVLYMSGYTDKSIVHHGMLEKGVAFLEKPFTPDALARKVRGVLDVPHSPEQNVEFLRTTSGNVAQTVEV